MKREMGIIVIDLQLVFRIRDVHMWLGNVYMTWIEKGLDKDLIVVVMELTIVVNQVIMLNFIAGVNW